MPEGAVYVGRPGKWGNPFIVYAEEVVVHDDGRDWYQSLESGGARKCAVDLYREWLPERLRYHARIELAGRDLACWCPLEDAQGNRVPCHADVLLEVANR